MGMWLQIFLDMIDHEEVLLLILFGFVIIGCVLIKRLRIYNMNFFISLCDPMIIGLIFGEVTAAIVPIFMYSYGWMYDESFFSSYILSELALFFGIFLMNGKNKNTLENIRRDNAVDISTQMRKKMYLLTLIIYLGLKVAYFYSVGIPLFSDSYYTILMAKDTFLTRLTICFYLMVCLLWIDSFSYIKTKLNYLVGLIILATFILSNQKGLISYFLFALFFINLYRLKKKQPTMVVPKKLIILGAALVFVVVMIPLVLQVAQSNNNVDLDPFTMFIMRIIGNGDSFPLFYGLRQTQGILQEHTGIFEFIFANISVFKIDFGYNSAYIPNNALAALLTSVPSEYVSPVIRHNIIGIKLFGVDYAFIYSLFLGLMMGLITRYVFRRIVNMNFLEYIIYCDLYVGVINCSSNYTISGYFDPFLIDSVFIFIVYKTLSILYYTPKRYRPNMK